MLLFVPLHGAHLSKGAPYSMTLAFLHMCAHAAMHLIKHLFIHAFILHLLNFLCICLHVQISHTLL